MQNSEALQAWIQGRMATFRIFVLVSKTEIRSMEVSFLSRSLRMRIINLDLVSMPEIEGDLFSVSSRSLRLSVRNSRSRLDVRDWIGETLILVLRMKKWLSLTSVLRVCSTMIDAENLNQFIIFDSLFSLEPQAWSSWGKGERFSFSLLIKSNTMFWICVLGQSVGFQGFSFLPIPDFVFWWFHYL